MRLPASKALAPFLARWAARALLVVSFVAPQEASAKNLDLLIRYLIPVFIAQNFSVICRANNPQFLADWPSDVKMIDDFANEMKQEITDGLSDADAQFVALIAANNARDTAREAVRKINPDYPKLAAEPTAQWCKDDARSYILQVIKTDQVAHDHVLEILKAAKQ